jgi:fibronectin type 3 domain-containing protein
MFLEVPELVSCTKDTSGIILEYKQNENADSYRIYRKTLYTGWTLLETVAATNEGAYTDKNVIDGTEYIYTVRAVNENSVSYYNTTGISCAE